ncbi:MAG: MSHA pilin protein MshD [Gammaproteobacteria bacterium]|jgi:MSHA pilin protein MshD
MSPNKRHFYAHGFTLIEIIVTIVVLAIAGTTLLSVFTSTARTSADPMIQQQAITIAEAYMEEILLKNFSDPQGVEKGTREEGETRINYDDVQDYNWLGDNEIEDKIVRDQNNNVIDQLLDYEVTVTVIGAALNGISANNSMLIKISVIHPAIDPIVISGYRANY